MIDRILNTAQAAEILGVQSIWVATMCAGGRLDCQRAGRQWRVPMAEVLRYKRKRDNGFHHEILSDPEKMLALYQEAGTFAEAAKRIGCSRSTFATHFRGNGIEITEEQEPPEPMTPERFFDMVHETRIRLCIPPPRCPRHCPGWMADGDCLRDGCIYERRK